MYATHKTTASRSSSSPNPTPTPTPTPTPNEVHEISRTQEIEWPYDERHHRRVWDEVITVEPTSLTDVVVLSLWHRRRKGGIGERMPLLVGETRVPVLTLALALALALNLTLSQTLTLTQTQTLTRCSRCTAPPTCAARSQEEREEREEREE